MHTYAASLADDRADSPDEQRGKGRQIPGRYMILSRQSGPWFIFGRMQGQGILVDASCAALLCVMSPVKKINSVNKNLGKVDCRVSFREAG